MTDNTEYNFIQAIMELQKSLVEINAALQEVHKNIDHINKKMDELVIWEDFNDAEIARERLNEISSDPDSLISSYALANNLKDLLLTK